MKINKSLLGIIGMFLLFGVKCKENDEALNRMLNFNEGNVIILKENFYPGTSGACSSTQDNYMMKVRLPDNSKEVLKFGRSDYAKIMDMKYDEGDTVGIKEFIGDVKENSLSLKYR
jgi:hypothetical protein